MQNHKAGDEAVGRAKRWLVRLWFVAVLLVAIGLLPYFYVNGPGMDLGIYVNQVHHVVRGIDPFDVLKQKVDSEEYYPLGLDYLKTERRNKIIDANAPWAYAYSLPLAVDVSLWTKWSLWCCFQLAFLGAIISFAFYYGRNRGVDSGWFMAASALSVGTSFVINFQTGNYILMVLAALAGMLFCLEKRKDVLAGVCWALVMTKPQDGLLIAIPLLLGRRWKVIAVAASICLFATWIASFMTGKQMIELILQVPQIKSGAGHPISECARLIPEMACRSLVEHGWTVGQIQTVNFIGGAALCLGLSFLVRKSGDWVVRFVPAVFCASIWTYMRPYDRCIFFVLQMALAGRMLAAGAKKERLLLCFMMVMVFSSCLEMINACTVLLPAIGERLDLPWFAGFVCAAVSRINAVSTAALAVSVVGWCVMEYRRSAKAGGFITG